MTMLEQIELLFFDTFAHDNTEEINLDLVQFPKPVFVTEVRIIPLGARVQADFPGGVRLGATNPSQFDIEFFVNDLGKPGASTFETLGGFKYDQNGCINLECAAEESIRKIPTDGLVLKGWYTTITLAVYGTLTNKITEQIIQPVVNPSLPAQPNTIADVQQICSSQPLETEWPQENIQTLPIDYNTQQATPYQTYNQQEPFTQDYEYYSDVPKDPRSYLHNPETEWDSKSRSRVSDADRDKDRERNRDVGYQKQATSERDHNRPELRRDREKRFSRSQSGELERPSREYRDNENDKEAEWKDHDHQEYIPTERSEHDWSEREKERGHEKERERCYKHDDNYRRSHNRDERERDDRKRPRTPPIQSPKRPHTPLNLENKEILITESKNINKQENSSEKDIGEESENKSPINEPKEVHISPIEEPAPIDVEEFEPILSDEDILDDGDHYQDLDYDYTTYTNNDDIIKLFTPGVTPLLHYPKPVNFYITENSIDIDDNLRNCIGISDDYFKSGITKFELSSFDRLNTEIKEEFIHLCERVMGTVGPSSTFCDIVKLYIDTKSMNVQNLKHEDNELIDQVKFIVETIMEWLKISLNYELANIQDQPAYKIRHIKCGVRLADYCCKCLDFLKLLWQNDFNIHKELLNLYEQEFMALSIKLIILKALDSYLQHKFSIEKFLLSSSKDPDKQNGFNDDLPVDDANGYKTLVGYMMNEPLVRAKFAISSILRKLNLFEIIRKLHVIVVKLGDISHDISAEEINLITKSLNEILRYCHTGPFVLSQPKRFLPVSSQFEIIRNESYGVFVEYFEMFSVLQCFVLLLTYHSTLNLPLIKTPIFGIISRLLDKQEGLHYLSENVDTVNVLLKCLCKTDDQFQYEYIEMKSHHLGLKIAYKIHALYHIDYLLATGRSFNFDCDTSEVIDHLHELFCLTFNPIGKVSCAEVLGLDNNIQSILQFLEFIVTKEKTESIIARVKKSTGIAYIVDLLLITVSVVSNIPIMEKYSKMLIHIINQQDIFEESVSLKLIELRSYMIPFEGMPTLSYDNIASFVEIIDRNCENAVSNLGVLTTALRILEYLGIAEKSQLTSSQNPLSHYIELKYKHVILQLYTLDGMSLLGRVLQKINDHYEQPSIHSSAFVSSQGWSLLNVIEPTILLVKQMLSYVIQCRNTNFRDLTAIPIFLQTYSLLHSFPPTSPGFFFAQEVKSHIVDTLLVYTQPVSDQINEKDSLTKSLWTQMCGEIIKYVTQSPHTFIPGLLILSEILPLPLPIQTVDELSKDEISWVINLRKLWSAHLHPHSAIMQDMVNKLCISTQTQLLNLLRRICVQIADLSANSAIMIARGILDNIYDALIPKEDAEIAPCNSHIARLLNFLACLVTHNTIKCAVLHVIHTNSNVTLKTEERYVSLIPAFAQVLKTSSTINSHVQCQECILSIIQSFCDTEITLMQNSVSGGVITSDEFLTNALPIKDHLLAFIQMIWEHLISENSFVTYLPILRILLLLSEHDYGFYHLKEHLLKKTDVFVVLLDKLSTNFSKENGECLSTLNTLIEFLRVCNSTDEESDTTLLYTPRKSKLSLSELKSLIGWTSEGKPENHQFFSLQTILKEAVAENSTFESFLEGLTAFLKILEEDYSEINKDFGNEIILAAPESLLVQFSCRAIFSSSDVCDERLTASYWLAVPSDEGENELEHVPCDLIDICRQNLRPEYSLIKDIEKLCRISRTEIVDDKEKRIDDENMKKPFVTPTRTRGFPRTVPQRPDLFRSRPPNTSRPPSLHVDDFVALETCGAQPTGPTGYNKISRDMLASTRIARGTRGRAFVTSERSVQYRQMPWWGAGMGRGPYQM
ncbi:unnamed protein product [Phaedon cochleariae]|uniref:Virilizer N-terminal domain-containing protein n=1 Tax=Phaedon cochleariae TaxID=80249 RepID=A0A9P0GT52_PHACE|nr:unnamed protein product [Phaedon cochleariae]